MPSVRYYQSLPNLRQIHRNPKSSNSPASPQHSGIAFKYSQDDTLIKEILKEKNFYSVLGVNKRASTEDIRRNYLQRSRQCHPDKHPDNPLATEAFQKLSTAYETLKEGSTRRSYDYSGDSIDGRGIETFAEVLVHVYFDFMEGNFDNLLNVLEYWAIHNPALEIEREYARDFLDQLRNRMLVVKSCFNAAQPSLLQLHDLHLHLNSLSYFNVVGRLKLVFELIKTVLQIPLIVNNSLEESFLGERSVKLLFKAVRLVEVGEDWCEWMSLKVLSVSIR